MSKKQTTFKQRIRRNDLKTRNKTASGLRKRMGVTRRTHNKYDRVDNNSRTMEELVSDISDGTAMPTQEFGLDPRSLTDLLMQPRAVAGTTTATTTTATAINSTPTTSLRARPQLMTELPADHPLAAADTRAIEEAERLRRDEQASLSAQHSNKNKYRHAGQPYLFWERVGLHLSIVKALRSLRFTHPTPVQQEVLTHIMDPDAGAANPANKARAEEEEEDGAGGAAGKSKKRRKSGASGALVNSQRDVLVSAETGSGKTLVFAMPVVNELLRRLDAQAKAAGKVIWVPEDIKAKVAALDAEDDDDEDGEEKKEKAEAEVTEDGKQKKTKKPTKEAKAAKGKKGAKRGRDSTDSGSGGKLSSRPAMKKKAQTTSTISALQQRRAPTDDPTIYVEDFDARLMHTLIVSPTRELAIQINDAFSSLTKFCPHVNIGCIVGGMAQEKQQRVLNRHPHILICTPGRLWDLVEKNEGCYLGHSISRRLSYIVLDEADKLLQSGRFEQLKSMLERIHSDILPAGFIQDREDGAEVGEMELESGRWDDTKQMFVPYTKEEKAAMAAGKKPAKGSSSKKKASMTDDEDDEENGKEDEDEEEEAEEEEGAAVAKKGRRKDQPRPIPMPPAPVESHRVITYVTSATLSLQSNYERKDLKADKKIIKTTHADTMGKVLQDLSIKPSNANVFALTTQSDVATKITETYLRCPDKSKDLYLYYFLRTYQDDRTIIFVNAISMLRRLVKVLECLGIAAVGLHASMQQRQRLKFIERFKSGSTKVLIATDVASRGIDIDGLKYVLHHQVPRTTDAYIHRCGRTARCGGTGLSVLMVNPEEHISFRKLVESLGRKEADVEVFALQPTVVHQLSSHLRIGLQIDKLQLEISKSQASDRWVDKMNKAAELDVDDMKDQETAELNRQKLKAIKILRRELELLQKKFNGSFGGKGAFRTGAEAVGARMAEDKLRSRADRQTLKLKK